MSGQQFYKKPDFLKAAGRRSFLLRAGLVTSGIFLSGCLKKLKPGNKQYENIKGKLLGPNAKAGHYLRDRTPLPKPLITRHVKTLIIGSGISGLSAARYLNQHGYTEFEVLELEGHIGGNSHSGKNSVSAYPFGAHYVTLANNEDELLLDFFKEAGIIERMENGLPFYNEYYLCMDPEERLLINGQWQEGLVPDFGIKPEDRNQIKRFFALVENYKKARGSDGKYAFDIPVDASSADAAYRKLDSITFQVFLNQQGFTAPGLIWYLNYCCKDDYGSKISKISAWAGLHYFASRRGTAANADSNAVLTWPQGNGWLMDKLAETISKHVRKGKMCCGINMRTDGKLSVEVLDIEKAETEQIIAENVILASPQFVNKRLLANAGQRDIDYDTFVYSPWLVANITVSQLPEWGGVGLCWDNVAYNTASVGYVNANQQHVSLAENRKVLTYYLPLCDYEPRIARLAAYSRTHEQWLDIIMPELEFMHPGISAFIELVDCWIWGHGMIAPTADFIWGSNRANAKRPVDGKIFFAHTDLSGISIFEEGFHQGIRAAKEVLSAYKEHDS